MTIAERTINRKNIQGYFYAFVANPPPADVVLRLDESLADGKTYEVRLSLEAELPQQICTVRFGGARADEKFFRDLRVAETLGSELQYERKHRRELELIRSE